MQQTGAELPLELIDAPAERIRGHAQTPRRLGEAAGADDLDEHRQIIQIKHEISP
jgi:hypothetical protein